MKPPLTALVAFLLLCTACARGNDGIADSAIQTVKTDAGSGETLSPDEPRADPKNGQATQPGAPSIGMGITHQVSMIGNAEGFRFDPSEVTIAASEAIRFIVVDGGPHNVVFEGQNLTSDSQTRLDQQISDRTAPLTSGTLSESGEAVTVSFAAMPAGRYPFFCGTHGTTGMRGTVIVQ